MKRILAVFALAASLLAAAIDIKAIPTLGNEAPQATVFQRYMVAKKRFEMDLFSLFSQKWGDISPTLALLRDRKLTQIEMENLRFNHLLKTDPGRIVTTEGLANLTTFEWTSVDNDALRKDNSDYVVLENYLATIERELSDDPNRITADKRLLTIGTDIHFLELTQRFNRYTDTLESELSPR